MAKIIFHAGTGTYFGLDDDVYVIDTDDVSAELLQAFYEESSDLLDTEKGRADYESMMIPMNHYILERVFAPAPSERG